MTYDPVQMGQLLKARYPQAYGSYPDEVVGQRWIDKNVPKPTAGGATATTDVLQGPSGTTPATMTSPNQQAPDLSGLSQFATPNVQSNQSPLLPTGVQNSTSSAQSATMSAPKSKPKTPSITLTPTTSPMYPQFNGLNKF